MMTPDTRLIAKALAMANSEKVATQWGAVRVSPATLFISDNLEILSTQTTTSRA